MENEFGCRDEKALIALVLHFEEKIYGLHDDLKRRVERGEITQLLAVVIARLHVRGILEGAGIELKARGRADLLAGLVEVAEREVSRPREGALAPGLDAALHSAQRLTRWARERDGYSEGKDRERSQAAEGHTVLNIKDARRRRQERSEAELP